LPLDTEPGESARAIYLEGRAAGPNEAKSGAGREDHVVTETMAMRRRREIEFLARELFGQAEGLLTAVGDLVPAELAAGGGELADGSPLRAVAERLDDALLCFNLLQQELGLPAGAEPRYGRLVGEAREPMPAAG
jgi:hypothetical protein